MQLASAVSVTLIAACKVPKSIVSTLSSYFLGLILTYKLSRSIPTWTYEPKTISKPVRCCEPTSSSRPRSPSWSQVIHRMMSGHSKGQIYFSALLVLELHRHLIVTGHSLSRNFEEFDGFHDTYVSK